MAEKTSGYLDEFFYETLQDEFSVPKLGLKLILKRLDELGIILSDSQICKLGQDLEEKNIENVFIDLDDDQEKQLKSIQGEDSNSISLHIEEVEDLEEDISDLIGEILPEVTLTLAESLVDTWKSHARRILRRQRRENRKFNKAVFNAWGNAIDMLEMLATVCMEEGARFNDEFRELATENNDCVFNVLAGLHARGCQVAFEILLLLKNGFADGAFARWRTLHELAVIAMFIQERGQDIAIKYLDHTAITDYWDAKAYQDHCEALSYLPLDEKEFREIRILRDKLLEKYGMGFDKPYGWAVDEIDSRGRIGFADIERSVKLAHLRPFLKLANINVHAGSKGISFRLGSHPRNGSILIAGPSIFGFADPGQNTAISINQLTTTFLSVQTNMDRLAFMQATQKLVGEIFDIFVFIEQDIQLKETG